MKRSTSAFILTAALCGFFAASPAGAATYESQVSAPTHTTADTQLTQDDVTEVQRCLKTMKFYKGALDGSWGPQTSAAVSDFQSSRGFTVNGMPTEETLDALDVSASRTTETTAGAAPAAVVSSRGGAVYRESSVENDVTTTETTGGNAGVISHHENGSTCLKCTNGVFGTGGTANMHSNEY